MSAEIITFPGETTLDVPCERVLQGAMNANLTAVIVIGVNDEGRYHAASHSNTGDMLVMLERFKQALMAASGNE